MSFYAFLKLLCKIAGESILTKMLLKLIGATLLNVLIILYLLLLYRGNITYCIYH